MLRILVELLAIFLFWKIGKRISASDLMDAHEELQLDPIDMGLASLVGFYIVQIPLKAANCVGVADTVPVLLAASPCSTTGELSDLT